MLSMIMAYDADGNVIATLDYLVQYDKDGNVIGLVDFEKQESSDNGLLGVWNVEGAKGSGTWPEWLGPAAHNFTVERRDGKIARLIPKDGRRKVRVRSDIEARVQARINEAEGTPAYVSDIVGSPENPLKL